MYQRNMNCLDVEPSSEYDDSLFSANDFNETSNFKKVITPSQLNLINKKIAMRYCEYKLNNSPDKMLTTDTVSISNLGIMFNSEMLFSAGILMRVFVEMPDYWARKSRFVAYRRNNSPKYFQVLARVITCEEIGKRTVKYQIMAEIVNVDGTDEMVLCDYLGIDYIKPEETSTTTATIMSLEG